MASGSSSSYCTKRISSGSLEARDLASSECTKIKENISSDSHMECPLCLLEWSLQCFPILTSCPHRACYDCLQQYLRIEISESRINISCPQCVEPIHPNDIKMILNDERYLHKYENFMLRRVLVTEPDSRWCPAPDCDYVVIASGCASCPKLRCCRPGCETSFCYHCKQEWHPNLTCDNARIMRNKHHNAQPSRYKPRSSSVTSSHGTNKPRDDVKACPSCKVSIIKIDDGSCNHITCSVCGTEFCWLCLKQIGDLHFLSPSGCTFWGKKPWSRKKKILWQLGMLIGAPVGIALIAGIAVPAIIIGVPVWVGRTLHARFAKQRMNQHKKNLLVTSGVVTSVIISPILTAVAVGIGVPILLAYVYGVVPISLCRSGGCGVTASSSGVKIDLDDEESEIGINASKFASDRLSVDTTLSNKGANPSIGEVSCGFSTSISMGESGCHLDKIGTERDASNAALAGSIISSSKIQEPTSMESSHKRYSLSSGQQSETASNTISFSERCSANLSLGDDASTRALAGSLADYKIVYVSKSNGASTSSKAVSPVEVHAIEGDNFSGKNFLSNRSCHCEDALSTKSAKLLDSRVVTGAKCVSFQTGSKGKLNKYESRSCDQLANYCIICDQVHRPCCPIYALSIDKPETSVSTSPQGSQGNNGEKNSKGFKSFHSGQFSFFKRKESIKSTVSDTSPAQEKTPQKLKRAKSSENSKSSFKKSSEAIITSTKAA